MTFPQSISPRSRKEWQAGQAASSSLSFFSLSSRMSSLPQISPSGKLRAKSFLLHLLEASSRLAELAQETFHPKKETIHPDPERWIFPSESKDKGLKKKKNNKEEPGKFPPSQEPQRMTMITARQGHGFIISSRSLVAPRSRSRKKPDEGGGAQDGRSGGRDLIEL